MDEMEIRFSVTDLPKVLLLVWELRMLADDMRVGADPFAERLERALDRFTDEPELEGGEG